MSTSLLDRITINPEIAHGNPTIRNKRYTVEGLLEYLAARTEIKDDTLGEFIRYRSPQVELLRHPNPKNRILHTEMIGEMNGYMHALLARRGE